MTALVRTLPSTDPDAHAFHELREDARVTLGSGGHRRVLTTRSSGGVAAGAVRASTHDPEPMNAGRVDLYFGGLRDQVVALETRILDEAAAASAGRQQTSWSARLVAFHQVIWVGRPGVDVVTDVRKGCRIEVRAHVGRDRDGTAVEDWVPDEGETAHIRAMFDRTFDRAEVRAGSCGIPLAGDTVGVFAPGTAGIAAHELIGHALEGDVACGGRSWILSGGYRCGPSKLGVVDDPRRGRGAWLVDDEGTVARSTHLIDHGEHVGLLLDRSTARVLGRQSTGHGRRATHLDRIQPRMGCTYIEAGADDPSEVLRSTAEGVFIRRLTGGHTDPGSGRATFVVEDADRIEDGKLTQPLDGFVIELAGPRSWMSIDRVANDLAFDTCVGSCVRGGQPLAVSVGAPTIRIGLIKVCC